MMSQDGDLETYCVTEDYEVQEDEEDIFTS